MAVADPPISGSAAPQSSLWLALRGARTNVSGSTAFDQDSLFVNGGADFGTLNGDKKFLFGVMGGYVSSNVQLSDNPVTIGYQGGSVGVYADYLSGDAFLNTTAKYDFLTMNYNDAFAGAATSQVHSLGIRSDLGYRFGSGGLYVEPMVSGAMLWTSIDDYDLGGTTVHSGTNQSSKLGAGARFGMKAAGADLSLTAHVWDELAAAPAVTILTGGPGLTVSGGAFTGVFGELGGHVNVDLTQDVLAFADASYLFNANASSATAQAGLAVKW